MPPDLSIIFGSLGESILKNVGEQKVAAEKVTDEPSKEPVEKAAPEPAKEPSVQEKSTSPS